MLASSDERVFVFHLLEGFVCVCLCVCVFVCFRGVGVDIDGELCEKARRRVHRHGLDDMVRVEEKTFLGMDLMEATLVTIFLLPECMPLIKEEITRFLQGDPVGGVCRRVVTVHFPMGNGFVPAERDSLNSLYLYTKESLPPTETHTDTPAQ